MSDFRWHVSGLMFQIAVEGFGRDRLPYPIRYIADDQGVETAEDYQRLRDRTVRELAGFANRELFDALTVLLEPRVRVEVHGFFGRDFGKVVRVHAGIVGQSATVAVQLPGPTQAYGRDVILTRTTGREAAARIVAALPGCAAGRIEPVTGRRSDMDRAAYSRDPYLEEIDRIVRRPRSGLGEINVFRGGAIDSRPTGDGRGFHWMDYLPVDGRYLLHNHDSDEFTLTPASNEDITRRLYELIETTHRETAGVRAR
ncbi:ESX secretion-associated protein EspG [Nocardia bovistercoris]|uniref:ESX secretion-associated protein EspG n=1 Tax=Nocardia bovistercoris TaxID=2785916 RepID=A0A931I8W6_9NOCA|nr:ESX secretion-associated protein EspG [Nocardia bovistercoris]MBH0776844.1 ESX secretion-associated protein EspG [Nocardia bovistercoris]